MTAGLPSVCSPFTGWPIVRPRRGAALGFALGGQAPFCGYYTVFAGLTVAFAVLVAVATRRRWTDVRYWASIAVAAAVATAIALLMFVPVRSAAAGRRFSEAIRRCRLVCSANWRTYFASSAYAHAGCCPSFGTGTSIVPRVHRGYWRRGRARARMGLPTAP